MSKVARDHFSTSRDEILLKMIEISFELFRHRDRYLIKDEKVKGQGKGK